MFYHSRDSSANKTAGLVLMMHGVLEGLSHFIEGHFNHRFVTVLRGNLKTKEHSKMRGRHRKYELGP